MDEAAEKRQALAEVLAQRFGEAVAVPEEVAGLEVLLDLARHRSQREYQSRAVPAALVRLLLAVALSAPSKSDLQQADVIEIGDAQTRAAIAKLIPTMPWVAAAPVFLVVCGNGRRILEASALHGESFANRHLDHFFNATVDAALVLKDLITAAEAVGLGTCPISVIRNHATAVSDLLALPDHVFPVAGLCLGWPAGSSEVVARLPLDLTLHRDRYHEGALEEALLAYDRRRGQREGFDPESDTFVGWSRAKARMYAEPQRQDFGAFVRSKGFKLD